MIRRFAALLGAGTLVLAACGSSHHDDAPTSPPVSSTPPSSPSTSPSSVRPSANPSTVPADVPTTGPNLHQVGEQPPKPQGVADHTAAGAQAFAKFYYLTVDWGYATTNSAYMRHYFQKSCLDCLSDADGLDNTRRAGLHFLGGRFTITDLQPAGPNPKYQAEAGYYVKYDLTSGTAVDKDGNIKNADVAHAGLRDAIWLAWKNDAWTVMAVVPEVQR